MRARLAVSLRSSRLLAVLALFLACKSAGSEQEPTPMEASSAVPTLTATPEPSGPRPLSSAVVAVERELQAGKLLPPARRGHVPRIVFGKGVVARLRVSDLQVFDVADFRLLETVAVDAPRAVLALADGALLVVAGQGLLRWEPGKHVLVPSRLVLLPGAAVYADARAADLIWVFDGASSPPTLSSFRLGPGASGVLLPEQVIQIALPRSGTFGVTREGVWLYLSGGHAERFGPSGARLPPLNVPASVAPAWLLPARRLDQGVLLTEAGEASRVLLSPSFKSLARVELMCPVVAADVGNDGELFAAVVVSGAGPRFSLVLRDKELAPLVQEPLVSEPPTGQPDWVERVTRNQEVVVAPRQPRIAVGGPDRLTIFDERGTVLFSIPSQ